MRSLWIWVVILFCVVSPSAQMVNLAGTVTDSANNSPLSGVIVVLATLGYKDTTGSDGKYSLMGPPVSIIAGKFIGATGAHPSIKGGFLFFNLPQKEKVTAAIYSPTGRAIGTIIDQELAPGTYRAALPSIHKSAGIYCIKIISGNSQEIVKFLSVSVNENQGQNRFMNQSSRLNKKLATVVDTLLFEKIGYVTKNVPITSYESAMNITMTLAVPSAPVISGAVAGDRSAMVPWDSVSGATSYNLYYKAGTTVDMTSGTKLTGVTSPKQVTGLTDGTQYAFAVSAVNAGGESGLSNIVNAVPMAAPVISGIIIGDGNATVRWGAVIGATSYNLYYATGATVTISGTKLTGVTSPNQVTGLTDGTQYAFAVSAVNAGGESQLSAAVTATPNIIVDIDGNVYHAATIGTQVWMVENLATTKYNDGTAIPLVTDNTAWDSLKTPGYCWYPAAYGGFHCGALYNWYAVNTGKLAPTGWHVSTDSEWTVLTTFLGGESVAAAPLKETGTTRWVSNTGATNTTGFSALPGGYRNWKGFYYIGTAAYWWTSTACDSAIDSWHREISSLANVYRNILENGIGCSVRCVRDN